MAQYFTLTGEELSGIKHVGPGNTAVGKLSWGLSFMPQASLAEMPVPWSYT